MRDILSRKASYPRAKIVLGENETMLSLYPVFGLQMLRPDTNVLVSKLILSDTIIGTKLCAVRTHKIQ